MNSDDPRQHQPHRNSSCWKIDKNLAGTVLLFHLHDTIPKNLVEQIDLVILYGIQLNLDLSRLELVFKNNR